MKLGLVIGSILGLFLVWSAQAQAQTLSQNAYRFYMNEAALQPTDPWPPGPTNLGENTPITASDQPPGTGGMVRIRMTVQVSGSDLAAGQTFKLQWGQGSTCSTIGTWSDVDTTGGAGIWRGYDNANVTDGQTVSALLLTASDVAETYEEQNSSASTPNGINVSQDGEWDWVVQNNGATGGASYCFRMVKGDNTALDSYLDYPKLIVPAYNPAGQRWRWYRDTGSETPSDSLLGENVQGQGILNGYKVKLRLTIREMNGVAGNNIKMKLQYGTSSSFTAPTDLTESGSCVDASLWCYADGVDIDNDAVTTRVLSDSTAAATHNESGTSSSSYTHAASSAAEWEFTIRAAPGLVAGTVYYFRAYDATNGAAVSLGFGQTSPSMKAGEQTLSLTVAGLASGVSIEGVTLDVTSTATSIPWGTVTPNSQVEAGQRLTITTDAFYGYKILMRSPTPLLQTGSLEIKPINGTNASPAAWGYDLNTQSGSVGYHAGDDALSSGSTRFAANDTWAKVELLDVDAEVAYSAGPATSETADIVFRVEISALQDAGSYTLSDLNYIVVAVY